MAPRGDLWVLFYLSYKQFEGSNHIFFCPMGSRVLTRCS